MSTIINLLDATPVQIRGGDYVFVVESAGNAVSLAVAVDGSSSQQIEDFSYTADANGVVTLPAGTVTATLGSSTSIYLSELPK